MQTSLKMTESLASGYSYELIRTKLRHIKNKPLRPNKYSETIYFIIFKHLSMNK